MSEIQIVYGSWPDDQRLKEAKRLRDLTDDPVETSYWDGFVLGIRRRIAGEDVGEAEWIFRHCSIPAGCLTPGGWKTVGGGHPIKSPYCSRDHPDPDRARTGFAGFQRSSL
jgi:hypothetical protein